MSLRVFLSREVTVEVFGQITRRTSVLGEAILVALPPVASTLNREEGVLDWEGAVRCADNISSGGFFTHHLTVRVSIHFFRPLGIQPTHSVLRTHLGFHCAVFGASSSSNVAFGNAPTCSPHQVGHRLMDRPDWPPSR